MISEDFQSEFNSLFGESDQYTQTSASSLLYIPQHPNNSQKKENEVRTVFECCQIIQDPDYPKSVTIVKEFVTEEVKVHSNIKEQTNKAKRYKYTREVIHPFLTPKSNATESCEVLVREALTSAKKDFPDFHPSLQVYHAHKSLSKTKQHIGENILISKIDAQTSYVAMNPDKVSLLDCDQIQDLKKCKIVCKEPNEQKKTENLREKTSCGKCEKPINCTSECNNTCDPKSTSSCIEIAQDQDIKDNLSTNEDYNNSLDEFSVTENREINTKQYFDEDFNQSTATENKDLNEISHEVIITEFNRNKVLSETIADVEVTNFIESKIQNDTPEKVKFTHLNRNEGLTKFSKDDPEKKTDEVIVTSSNNQELSDEINVTNLNSSVEFKEIYDVRENKDDRGNIVPNIIFESKVSPNKSFIKAHNEAISTLKVAMRDLMGIVYRTSQDTASLLATASAKAILKMRTSEEVDTDTHTRETELKTKSSEKLSRLSVSRNQEPEDENNLIGPGARVLGKALRTADSALGLITKKITKSLENLPDAIKKSSSTSSPYDEPKIDNKTVHASNHDTTNGMFSALKNKIYSIFSEIEPKSDTPVSRSSSGSSFSYRSDDDTNFRCSMPPVIQKVDVKKCAKHVPAHSCDKKKPCDPLKQMDNCPEPFICQERIKNPAWPGEITTCKTGPFMYAKTCVKVIPPHPCDPKPPCSLKSKQEREKKLPCIGSPLCFERIKNPEYRKKEDPTCDETK